MAKPTPTSSRKRPCFLLDTVCSTGKQTTTLCATLQDLAAAVRRLRYAATGVPRWDRTHCEGQLTHWLRAHVRCYSPNGRPLDPVQLMKQRVRPKRRNTQPLDRSELRGNGPVHGIRCRRGGPRLKHPRTMAQRRQSLSWLMQEGQPVPRPSQRENHLPNSRDLRWRDTPRSWKAQSKGRKAWDRSR